MEQKGFWNWAEGTEIELVDPMVEEVWGGSLLLCDVQKRETEKGLQAQAPACLSMLQNVGRAKAEEMFFPPSRSDIATRQQLLKT